MAASDNSDAETARRPYTVRPWKRKGTEYERFIEKVEKTETCWLWRGALNGPGYGIFGTPATGTAHRWSYRYFRGPIPNGYQVDHLCRVAACVNPDHLEAVTRGENMRRAMEARRQATHCKRGHEWTVENTKLRKDGARTCRECAKVLRRQRDRLAATRRRIDGGDA